MKTRIFFISGLLSLIIVMSCGRKNNLFPNEEPQIFITTSYGADSLNTDIDSLLFQQTIRWRANDPDGLVEKYAFRILNENMQPVSTSGYESFEADTGWVYHYQNGANENIPMDDHEAKLTIWSDQVYALINFPANIEGDSSNVISVFEVKCIDDRNGESLPARKYFNSFSHKPIVTGTSSKGDIDGETVGLGFRFKFTIFDEDPFIGDVADHFEYKIEKRNLVGTIVDEPGYGIWRSTKELEYLDQIILNPSSEPALTANNFAGDAPQDSTYLIFKAVDLAGIESDPDSVSFTVKEGFSPGSLIYINDIFLIGENHFVTYTDDLINQVIPFRHTPNGLHYSTPFWIDKSGNFTVINSNDLLVYLHWGWHGEFEEDSPFGKIEDTVLDEITEVSYFSEIAFFDVRFDDEPYYYLPFPPNYDLETGNIFTDDDGKEWLRIPMHHSIDQEVVLPDITNGVHKLEVRAVDLQGVVDSTPSELIFKAVQPVPEEEKQGILILDDDPNHSIFAPEETIDEIYFEILSDYEFAEIDREAIYEMIISDSINMADLHFNKAVLSPTDLQEYKLILYHSDNLTVDSDFYNEYDVLNLYLKSGGNLIFSSGSNLKFNQEVCIENQIPIFSHYFGISAESNSVIIPMNGNNEAGFLKLNFFVSAVSENEDYSDINLKLPSFVNLVTSKEGLGPVAYFQNFTSETIYSYGCKVPENWDDTDDNDQYPSLNQFNEFNGKAVALRNENENGKCWIFGFPLSFMEPDEVTTLIDRIMLEIE